jgi:hypothetical protein
MPRSARQSAAAVQSLFRIRAYETTDAAGLRRVWHQGAEGADLLTWVNAEGKVIRQELTLLEDHFVWTPEGLRTASVEDAGGSTATAASSTVRFDAQVSRERVWAAHAALLEYQGQDKYILNIRRILAHAMGKFLEGDEFVMTKNQPIPEGELGGLSAWSLAVWIGVALAVAAAVAAVLMLR